MAKSISSSPKIAVDGDYDSYARRPRKKYLKFNAPTEMNTIASQTTSQVTATGPTAMSIAENNGQTATKGISTSDSIELELPIKTFPNSSDEKAKHASVIYDSLPKRKQAKVELMKQARRDFSEDKLASQHSNRESVTEAKSRPHQENHRNESPQTSVRRDTAGIENDGSLDRTALNETTRGLQSNRSDKFLRLHEPFTSNSNRSLVKAMVVRSLLPPIKSLKAKRLYATRDEINQQKPSELEVTNKANDTSTDNIRSMDMKYHFQRGSRLRQGSTKYVYRPNSNHSRHSTNRKSPSQIWSGTDDSFRNGIHCRASVNYRGMASIYKRSTSPTLGEEALELKVTNRLPTRQIHPMPRHDHLYSEILDYRESWRRPPSNKYSKGVLLTASEKGKLTIHPPYETTFWRRTILTRVPQHRMPVHRARVLHE